VLCGVGKEVRDVFVLVRNEYLKYVFTTEVKCTLVAVSVRYRFSELPVSWYMSSSGKIITDLSVPGVYVQSMYKVNFLQAKYKLKTK
jgi:hypothetical protein